MIEDDTIDSEPVVESYKRSMHMGTLTITAPYCELETLMSGLHLSEEASVEIISDTAKGSHALRGDAVAVTHAERTARYYMRTWTKTEGRFVIWCLRVYVRKRIKALGYVPDHASVDHALTIFKDHYRPHKSGYGHVWSDHPITH